MTGDCHVPFCGSPGVRLPRATRRSPDSLLAIERTPDATERAARLLVDVVGAVHEALLVAALENDSLLLDEGFVANLDRLAESISTVQIEGEVEYSKEGEEANAAKRSKSGKIGISMSTVNLSADSSGEATFSGRNLQKETRKGRERRYLNFAEVSTSLSNVLASVSSGRLWLLLDEWGATPLDTQPYLAEFLARTVLPIRNMTVKIAAIEQHSRFRAQFGRGFIGIELGADVTANLDLDEFMIFDQSDDRARTFFRALFYKHLTAIGIGSDGYHSLSGYDDVVRVAFTDSQAFDELVRAANGVPRDAINIAAKAALIAGLSKITTGHIQRAARTWFHSDKERAISDHTEARQLLSWIINEVIRKKELRTFLVREEEAKWSGLTKLLLDARILHLVRRGCTLEGQPYERYVVYAIDYGAYLETVHSGQESYGSGKHNNSQAGLHGNFSASQNIILRLDDFDRYWAGADGQGRAAGSGSQSQATSSVAPDVSGSRRKPRRRRSAVKSPTPPSVLPVRRGSDTADELSVHVRYDARDTVSIHVAGELDMMTGPQLRAAVFEALESGHIKIRMDVAGITFLGTSGLAILVEIREAVHRFGGPTPTLQNAPRRVVRPMTIAEMNQLFDWEWDE